MNELKSLTKHDLVAAGMELGNWFKQRGQALEDTLGIQMKAVATGSSSTYEDIKVAFEEIEQGGDVRYYCVWSGGCNDTIYFSPEYNHWFRFVHDYTHYELGADFSPEGECQVHSEILEQLANDGMSWLARMLYIVDTYGQTYYGVQTEGQYVTNQRLFAHNRLINTPIMASDLQLLNYLKTGNLT